MRVGRNEACPCGSGMKYKNCCVGKSSRRMSRGLIILIIVIAAVAAIGVIPSLVGDRAEKTAAVSGVPARGGSPQPGPAPAGKVWSAEHNHWHDAPQRTVLGGPPAPGSSTPVQVIPQQVSDGGGQPVTQPAQTFTPPPQTFRPPPQTFTPAPQPPGEVPPGKVWSTEHGHWHDAPAQ